jgi:murein L,D-transpeptidase YafK
MIKLLLLLIAPILAINSLGAKIPESKRSKDAMERNLPNIEEEFKQKGLTLGNNVFIRIFKKTNDLELWVKKDNGYKLFKNYEICYYSGGLGSKTKRGDCMAPEGFYRVLPSNLNPLSAYHLSFDIGYPNAYDRAHAYTGSAICIHGNCVSIGCFAMSDAPIEEIFTIVVKAFENGQKAVQVQSFPFRMTDENMGLYKNSEWADFWRNLKEGYDIFETNNNLPTVSVKNKRYTFN